MPRAPVDSDVVASSRLVTDRRGGVDRRRRPRRYVVAGAHPERRSVVDRRRGAERRSTLDRRGRVTRDAAAESPGEHLRNALQLLTPMTRMLDLDADQRNHLVAGLDRLRHALRVLERRTR
ncbi:MAG TPA: hypothetical protein VEU74_09250 [Gemmatimonadales bacterium]|nr:hypothetical protein [Gemmatimonadales bacterium]